MNDFGTSIRGHPIRMRRTPVFPGLPFTVLDILRRSWNPRLLAATARLG
jgi:hypothetical protein